MNLPTLLLLEQHSGDWGACLNAVYSEFMTTCVKGGLTFAGLPVRCAWNPPTDDKHFSFWHIISELPRDKDGEEERIPDIRRCERIRWIAYVIGASHDRQRVYCWKNERRTKRGVAQHVVLYFVEERYVVILRCKPDCYQIATTYVVTHQSRHDDLLKERTRCKDPRD